MSNQEIRLEAGLDTSYLQCRFRIHPGDGARDRAGDVDLRSLTGVGAGNCRQKLPKLI